MTFPNFSDLKQKSQDSLGRCGNQKTLALIYAGGLVGSALLLTVLDYILSEMIEGTGGLRNMGTRSILSSLQTMLPIVQSLALLGWNAGYAMAVLNIIRGRYADHRTLLSGFNLFFPMLRAMLFEGLLYFNLMIVSLFLSVQIYSFTPWAKELIQTLEPMLPAMMEDPTRMILDEATLMAALWDMVPMVLIFGVLYLLLFLPISYRLRFSTYCLVDAPRAGALRAMVASRQLLRKNCFRLFLIDLRFWWYHGLLALASLLPIVPMTGFQFSLGFDFTYYLCYGAYLVITFVLYILAMNRVECTYAAAYESLLEPPQENTVILGNIFDM